jgi:predicted dithiol-disulfide oxidoreductase (DUF899 family)
MDDGKPSMPIVVSHDVWKRELDELRVQEKALTRQTDLVNGQRRRLPMVKIDHDYRFQGADGSQSLLDLFEGRRQLITYHFMFGPSWDAGCPGCSWVVDAMSHPSHLNARDTSLVLVSRAPVHMLHDYRLRMGWELPWVSSLETRFNEDMGVTVDDEEHHGVSVFLRDGDTIFRTYFTGARGVEHLGSHWTYLDLTPFGRQEGWEKSPPGWPQRASYVETRRHDEY